MKGFGTNYIAAAVTAGAIMFALGVSLVDAQTGNSGITGPGGSTGATGAAASDTGVSGAIERKPLLTAAQRTAIYAEVSKDKSKTSPQDFAPVIGTAVPPMIELYNLPDDAVADIPSGKLYKYTMVEDKVVLVDPTKMRVIDVIGPAARQ